MKAVFKRDLNGFITTMQGYLFLAAFFLLFGFFFVRLIVLGSMDGLAAVFEQMSSVMLVFTPMLTMRLMVQESLLHTDLLLYSSPVSTFRIVLGKFLAAMTMVTGALAAALIYMVILTIYGAQNIGEMLNYYLGFLLLCGTFIAVGLCVSSLVQKPIHAMAVTVGVLVLFWMLDNPAVSATNPVLGALVSFVAIFTSFEDFLVGLIPLSGCVYLLSFSLFFLLLTCLIVERRKQGGMS